MGFRRSYIPKQSACGIVPPAMISSSSSDSGGGGGGRTPWLPEESGTGNELNIWQNLRNDDARRYHGS